jgi:hypothetical protein
MLEELTRAFRSNTSFVDLQTSGYWLSIRNGTDESGFDIALGTSDGGATAASSNDTVPSGSATKPFTAVAVMRLIERGVVGLDDAIAPHVDPFLKANNGTTLESLWGPPIRNVTVRMLLNMRSGMEDYNDQVINKLTLKYPKWDISPYDYLVLNSKAWMCPPGNCSSYNSINFMLLLMLVARHTLPQLNSDWASLDQLSSTFPDSVLGNYHHTQFYGRGPCSGYPGTTHYFYAVGRNSTTGREMFKDMSNTSCLNGWGFGNIGTSSHDLASFFLDVFGPAPKVVSGRSALLMQQFTGLLDSEPGTLVGDRHHYGLGVWTDYTLELTGSVNLSTPGIWPYVQYVGHAGDDYGTQTKSGYHPTLGISFSIMTNKPLPGHHTYLFCVTWRSLWKILNLPGGETAWFC